MNEKVQIATKNSWEYIKNWLGFNLEINRKICEFSSFSENHRTKRKTWTKICMYLSTFENAHVKENWIEINK